MKLPAIQFYPADWRKDPSVQSLSFHDRGVWFEMLCLMHESDQRGKLLLNGKPMSLDALSRLLGLERQVLEKTVERLLECGAASKDESGAIINRRMVRDENIRKTRRECGKMGGNPNLVNQNSNQNPTTQVNQKSTPSSSSSSSSSERSDRANLPTLKEVLAKAQMVGLAEWKATDWFNEMEGCGWLDHLGREIQNWHAVMMRVKVKWEADGRPMSPPTKLEPRKPVSKRHIQNI